MTIKHGAACLLLMFMSANGWAQDRNPVGEHAFYRIDRNRDRTSSIVSGGEMTARVLGGSHEQGEYQVRIDYQIDTYVNGRNKGSEELMLPAKYFSEEFLLQLRRDKYYEVEQFKIRHLGFQDARNMDGRFYPGCDILYFYDLRNKQLAALLADMIDPEMDDINITALVKPAVPVLGAVKLDIRGKYKGSSFKAGADYLP